ncbi:hypothetical protein E2562_004291 [Oryza meyeriana var. granulata]|uniref:Uncharacterized protein n=1 Tax=Oryza meyeriana var. granulata TaxID=110450 RepID=A0A6G1BSG1_9ORYZ|nr:hypothetical protein E2562_004291 [Oryza meyeriana var. granulata]
MHRRKGTKHGLPLHGSAAAPRFLLSSLERHTSVKDHGRGRREHNQPHLPLLAFATPVALKLNWIWLPPTSSPSLAVFPISLPEAEAPLACLPAQASAPSHHHVTGLLPILHHAVDLLPLP